MIKPQILFLDRCSLGINEIADFFSNFDIISFEKFQKNDFSFKLVTHIYTRFTIELGDQFLSKFPNLKCVISPTTGTEHISLKYLSHNNIRLVSLQNKKQILKQISSTTELTSWFIIEFARHFSDYVEIVRGGGGWDRYIFDSFSLRGKTLGIIGFGRIGKQVADVFANLGMEILFYDVNFKFNLRYQRVKDLNKIAELSDFISIHASGNIQNTNLIDKAFLLNLNSKGAYLINTARGHLVNDQDILDSLASGKLLGYATDSLRGEFDPSPNKNFLNGNPIYQASLQNPNIKITPHVGGSTIDSLIKVDRFTLRLAAQN